MLKRKTCRRCGIKLRNSDGKPRDTGCSFTARYLLDICDIGGEVESNKNKSVKNENK